MKKINLTERELTNIIKNIIKEDQGQGVLVKYKLQDYITRNEGKIGKFKIENGGLYIIDEQGRKFGRLIP